MPASLTINSLPFQVEGFARATTLVRLLERGRLVNENTRGEGVDGHTHEGKNQPQHEVVLKITVYGVNDSGGTPHPDLVTGVVLNIEEIQDTCIEPSKDAAVPLVLTLEDGSTRTADVECPQLTIDELQKGYAEGVIVNLHVRILAGKLTDPSA